MHGHSGAKYDLICHAEREEDRERERERDCERERERERERHRASEHGGKEGEGAKKQEQREAGRLQFFLLMDNSPALSITRLGALKL